MADTEFRMGGGLEYGDAGQLNDQLAGLEDAGLPPTTMPEEVEVLGDSVPEEALYSPEMDEYDEELLGPSRNDRPLTHGAPFGLGPSFVPARDETEQQYTRRVAERVILTGRAVPDDAKMWALRVLAGE